MPGLVQVWNSKSKKWVLINTDEKGGIVDMQGDRFEGIPVKGNSEKTFNESADNVEDQSDTKTKPDTGKKEVESGENKSDSDDNGGGFFGW